MNDSGPCAGRRHYIGRADQADLMSASIGTLFTP